MIRIDASETLARLTRLAAKRGIDLTAGSIADEPTPDDPGHPEYHRRQRVQSALAKLAAVTPKRYREATTDHADVLAWAAQVAASPDDAPSLMLWGPTGTGKTHAAYGAARAIAEAGPARFSMVAYTWPDLYAALRPGSATDLERERTMRRVMTTPLAILDDLGTTKDSPWTEEVTYRIINHRYNQCLPTVITTNVAPARLPELVGDRVASRLIEMTVRINMSGPDRRLVRR